MKHIYFTVTNDLAYDQRMHRICGSLAAHGYRVTLVGRKKRSSPPMKKQVFGQHRLPCFFHKGFLFYAEFNVRLFLFLVTRKADAVCAIDLDTILPCLAASAMRGYKRVYDAHEFFTEVKEVRTRSFVHKFWSAIERFAVPRFRFCYTVGEELAGEFQKRYGRTFAVIRNVPLTRLIETPQSRRPFIFYGGAVNEARGLEYLVPAMKQVRIPLVICGDGNFMEQLRQLIHEHGVSEKIELRGMVPADELFRTACEARLGLNLVEKEGLNQYFSLANKFFDYIQACLPQLTMNFPEYRRINEQYHIAVLIDELSVTTLAGTINRVLDDDQLLNTMRQNATVARTELCWEREEQHLLDIYQRVFSD